MFLRGSSLFVMSVPVLVLAAGQACTTYEGDTVYNNLGGAGPAGPPGRDGKDGRDGRDGVGGTAELPDEYPAHRPKCDTIVPLQDLEIDLWGRDGHSFYFEVTPEMRVASDEQQCKMDGGRGGVYQLGGGGALCPPSATNVRVVPAGSKECADTGKVELDLPGQSSWRAWSEIPNFKLDVGEFEDQKFKTGDKTLRMNNGQADSTILREATALAIWRAMGYPAPRTRFVQTQSNVWDYDFEPGVSAAHVMVQPYKKAFFSKELPEVTSAWEGEGNPFAGWSTLECEWSKGAACQDKELKDIVSVVQSAPYGEGFMDATAEVVDWPMIHRNQCLAALTGTGDDWIHNTNNVVIALREDGKIFYLPYSTDISGGHPWYPVTPYDGFADPESLAARCATDPLCREQALDTCDEMVDEFEELNIVETVVQERCSALTDNELDRPADAKVCESLAAFYEARPAELREELALLREGDGGMGGAGPVTGPGPGPRPLPID